MLKEIFHDRFENFEITRNCMENHASPPEWTAKVVFLVQMLPTFSGRCNHYFGDIRLKILRLPIFNMLALSDGANEIFQKGFTGFVFTES